MDEDGIYIENIEESVVSGIRLSDNKKITVPIESLSLLDPIDEWEDNKREEFNGHKAEPLARVAVAQWNHGKTHVSGKILMLGYLIRHSHNTSKIRLLGGDVISLQHYTYRIYHPTSEELRLFDKVEQDEFYIEKELKRTLALSKDHAEILDLAYQPHRKKLTRFLSVRGCTEANIQKAIQILTNNALETATNEV